MRKQHKVVVVEVFFGRVCGEVGSVEMHRPLCQSRKGRRGGGVLTALVEM